LKLHEYEARDLFEKHGIPIPFGKLCRTPEEARDAAKLAKGPTVVKSQILIAGRGKAGAIKTANTPEEAFHAAKDLLGSEFKGIKVTSVLVVKQVKCERELYLGYTVDRAHRKIALIASSEGGMDLEELAREKPDKIFRREVDPIMGLHDFEARNAAYAIGLSGLTASEFSSIGKKLYDIFTSVEADLAESNPLGVQKDGSLVALDSRMTLDDNSLFRHPEYRQANEEMSLLEQRAADEGLAFVQLSGDIGIIGNGAGLVMATLDVVAHFGGAPANFLDMGGGSNEEVVYKAVRLVLDQTNLKAVFLNVLGGITKCDEVARGLVRAIKDSGTNTPFTVRMVGNNEDEGRKILEEAGIPYLDSMEAAAETVVRIARRMNLK
jgi:succinyl-CoA synthetase beta subunit